MKATVSWFCVSCHDSESRLMEIKFTANEPGFRFVCIFLHLLPAKWRIQINTLCANCLEENQPSVIEGTAGIHR